MDKLTATAQIERLINQRNILTIMVILLGLTGACLSMVLLFKSEKVTMLPSNLHNQTYTITNNKAGSNYLKDRALQVAVRLFNLTPENVKQNLDEVLKIVPSSAQHQIKPFLISLSKDTLKKGIISSFIVETMSADEVNQEVIIKGRETKFFGSFPKSLQRAYKLQFKFNGVELQLTGITAIKEG